MSGPMKKHHTEKIAHVIWHGNKYAVPLRVMEKFKVSDRKANKTIDDVLGDITKESGEPAVLLRGLRYREGLTQVEFAKLINITQANLSAIENGKRTIGKDLAKRISKKFGIDYRLFL